MSPQSSIAHYRIISKLGEGGMGAVYRAADTKLNREVAIKVLPPAFADDPDRLARFTREAQVLAALNHPNIAAIYGVEEGAIVLELVEGETLTGPLSEEQALPLIHQLIDALEYAHEKGIIHRDLKPANIKVTPERRLKVLDFGLAKALSIETPPGDPAISPTMTMRASMAGVILGTAGYMSPEQARGQAIDKRSDIWAFGVVLYEILTGRSLFGGETISDTLAAVLRHDPDISAVPQRFRRLLRLCLMRDPRQRLRDISGARLLLEEPPEPSVTRPRRTGWIAAAAILAAIAALSLGVAWRATRPVDQPLMRLSVDLGPGALHDPRTVFVLSPNGRRIVFITRAADGRQVLATRKLDQAKVELLRGTEGASEPLFSPDGEWIAFFADSKLKKISVQGGSPVTLTAATPNARGASWGEDGSIVFPLTPAGGLSLVPASGGAARALTNPATKGQATHRWPQFLPGGRAIIFTAHISTTGLNDAEIDALDLKTGQSKIVQRGGFFGRYLPTGHLVYVHDGALFAVRFDPVRLETQGSPVQLLDDVAANVVAAAGRFDFAAAQGTFAYISGKPEDVPARPVWLDKTGKAQPVTFVGATAGNFSLSPNGRMVAIAGGAIGNENIKVWDSTRDVLTSITFNGRSNIYPVWTPDNHHLVFRSSLNDMHTFWWARADGGGEPRRLIEQKEHVIPHSFSPDGRRLAYVRASPAGDQDLWTLPLDISDPGNPKPGTPEIFLRTPDAEFAPMFSPDGRWIAYISRESGTTEVFVRPFPGPGGRWKISAGDGAVARWSRIGRQIFFVTSDGRIMVADYEIRGDSFVAGKPRLWTGTRVSVNIGQPNLELAPDGQRVLTSVNPIDAMERGTSVHVTFLLNFFDELRRRVP